MFVKVGPFQTDLYLGLFFLHRFPLPIADTVTQPLAVGTTFSKS